jgi:hypothetical protein
MTNATELADIAGQLRKLVAQPAVSRAEVEAWCDQAEQFRAYVRERHPEVELPHVVYHYLSDADIRARDPEYRTDQDRRIANVISHFDRGLIPVERSVNLSVSPTVALWGLAIAGALGALVLRSCR